jgi:hypothetical protein
MSVTTHAENSALLPNLALRGLLRWARTAIEAHARYRMNSAVSPAQFQRAEKEMRRYRRLMRAGR